MSVINFTKLQLEYALVSDFCDKPHLLVEEIITLELWCCFVARDFSICPFKLQKEFSFSFVRNTRRTVPFYAVHLWWAQISSRIRWYFILLLLVFHFQRNLQLYHSQNLHALQECWVQFSYAFSMLWFCEFVYLILLLLIPWKCLLNAVVMQVHLYRLESQSFSWSYCCHLMD